MNKLQFALVGCGKIAPRHAAEMARHGQLAAVCDIVPERADKMAASYNARAYYSIEELLSSEKNIDVIAVCSPNGLHASHSIKSLEAGIHVLCEKPMAISTDDSLEMMAASSEHQRKLFVVKSTRYNPALANLKLLLDSGKLGRLFSFQLNCFWNRPNAYYHESWKGTQALDGGTLYTQFSHYIDAMLWLLGDLDAVNGYRANMDHKKSVEFEDSGVASLKMSNGMIGGLNWSVNSFEKNMEVSLTILAERGSIRIAGEYMNKVDYQIGAAVVGDNVAEGQSNDYGFYKGSMSNHDKIYDNLVKALEDEQHPFTGAVDGLKTVKAIEQIYSSVEMLTQ